MNPGGVMARKRILTELDAIDFLAKCAVKVAQGKLSSQRLFAIQKSMDTYITASRHLYDEYKMKEVLGMKKENRELNRELKRSIHRLRMATSEEMRKEKGWDIERAIEKAKKEIERQKKDASRHSLF